MEEGTCRSLGEMTRSAFRYCKTSPEIIGLGVMMSVRFPLSLRNVEDLLYERGIDVCLESIRLWGDHLGTCFENNIRKHEEGAVLTAMQTTLEAGVATKTHILYRLHRLADGKPVSRRISSRRKSRTRSQQKSTSSTSSSQRR